MAKKKLTNRQREVLVWVADYYFDYGTFPSWQVIATKFGKTRQWGLLMIKRIAEKGHIKKLSNGEYRLN